MKTPKPTIRFKPQTFSLWGFSANHLFFFLSTSCTETPSSVCCLRDFDCKAFVLMFFFNALSFHSFIHSDSKQSYFIAWCLFTASKARNEKEWEPNPNPADPVTYRWEILSLHRTISVWEIHVNGTLLTVYHPILVDQSWEQTLFSQALLFYGLLIHALGHDDDLLWWLTGSAA